MDKKLSILIPVYNEWRTIRQLLEKLVALKREKEIIVLDDGSSDGTKEILNSISHPQIKIFRHPANRGKGAAIRTALAQCTGDIVLIQDADLNQDPKVIDRLVEPFLEDGVKLVYGSRFLAQRPKMKWTNYWANRFLTFLTNFLYRTKISDVETCFKAFRSEVIKSIPLETEGFEFEVEVTAKVLRKGFPIKEVPIKQEWYLENYHDSKKLNWLDGVKAIVTLFKYRFED